MCVSVAMQKYGGTSAGPTIYWVTRDQKHGKSGWDAIIKATSGTMHSGTTEFMRRNSLSRVCRTAIVTVLATKREHN
jgi:hypothetical protein